MFKYLLKRSIKEVIGESRIFKYGRVGLISRKERGVFEKIRMRIALPFEELQLYLLVARYDMITV